MESEKQRIRNQTLQNISRLSKHYRHQADTKIKTTVVALPQYIQSRCVCYYVSTQHEVDTTELIKKEIAAKKKHMIVPKIHSHSILLYEITSWDDLEKGTFGIMEPRVHCKPISPANVHCFLVPGVAFGKDTTRIGRGAGYYDRLLHTTKSLTIGLAYDVQIYPTVPHDAKDKRVDIIVTETATYL